MHEITGQKWALLLVLLGLVGLALATLLQLWLPLVLAAWLALLFRAQMEAVARFLGGRRGAATVLLLSLFIAVLLPLGFVFTYLTMSAVDLINRVLATEKGRSALALLVSEHPGGVGLSFDMSVGRVLGLLGDYGGRAWTILRAVTSAAISGLLRVFIFLLCSYVFLIEGEAIYRWLEEHAPIPPASLRRLAGAFRETGRGLLVGVLLTALSQALLATLVYFAIGIPSALVLGLLTGIAALIPLVGTALLWVPIAIGLAVTGRPVAALVLAAAGALLISTIDNVLRPWFAHHGKLRLPIFVLVLAVFGGIGLFGLGGLILGPLLVRLSVEALEMAREEGWVGALEREAG